MDEFGKLYELQNELDEFDRFRKLKGELDKLRELKNELDEFGIFCLLTESTSNQAILLLKTHLHDCLGVPGGKQG